MQPRGRSFTRRPASGGCRRGNLGACRWGEAWAAPVISVLLSASLSSAKCISGCDNGALYLILKYPASSQRGNPVNHVVVSFKLEVFLACAPWLGRQPQVSLTTFCTVLHLSFSFTFEIFIFVMCFKKSKTTVVNSEETAVQASPLPAMVFKYLGFGAVGEGKVLSLKAPCRLCAGDNDPHAVPVLHLCTYFPWFVSFEIQHTLVVLRSVALSSHLIY